MNIKKYIKIESDKGTHIKVEVFYTKGGVNYIFALPKPKQL